MNIQIPFTSLSANVYNQDELKDFLETLKTNVPSIDRWIKKTLRKWMINNYPDMKKVSSLPFDAPEWAQRALKNKDLFELNLRGRKFNEFKQDIEHAIAYLRTVRDPSRVGVEQAIREGNKLIEQQNKKAGNTDGELKVLYRFKNGWSFVSLLDKKALAREGKIMQHCVGTEQMGYMRGVANKILEIWSLRDLNNGPHCTIEYLPKEKKVKQIKGKQNKGVVNKYQPYVVKFLKEMKRQRKIENFDENDLINIGILDVKGVWYDIFNLPEGLKIDGDLFLGNTSIKSLPKGLEVSGYLDLEDSSIENLPEGLKVGGDLNLRNTPIKTLPEGLKVGKALYGDYTSIKSLPKELEVGWNLDLEDSLIENLPEGLKVGGSFYLRDTSIKALPEGLKVGGSLYLNNTSIKSLPKEIKVEGDLVLKNTLIKSLPEGLKVGGDLDISRTNIKEIYDIEIGGNLYLEFTRVKTISKLRMPDEESILSLEKSRVEKVFDDCIINGLIVMGKYDNIDIPSKYDVDYLDHNSLRIGI